MKLPPEEPFDVTPTEGMIPTVEIGTSPTIELLDGPESFVHGSGRVDVHTLVRARSGARASAFAECRRACARFAMSYRLGVITGAAVTAAGICAASWAWILFRWWRK